MERQTPLLMQNMAAHMEWKGLSRVPLQLNKVSPLTS